MRLLYTTGALVWALGVGAGLIQLWDYETGPGAPATAPSEWPGDSRIPRPRERPALVLVMHPQCSCSRATVAELARLQARVAGALDISVVVLSPAGVGRDWVESPLWQAAAAIRGVRMIRDEDGVEARRFGAATSGQALLYDRDGRLRFSGGITGSRGHEGDNAGRTAIERLVREEQAEHFSTFVFGCALS